ncbi:MAG TPA: ankyrin repeat domain-containing protein [Leptolyngbyaceae cyanobacterium]
MAGINRRMGLLGLGFGLAGLAIISCQTSPNEELSASTANSTVAPMATVSDGGESTATTASTQPTLNERLFQAINDYDLTAAEAALADGASPDAGDYINGHALMRAATKGNFEMVKLLLERGANANLAGDEGYTPLVEAVNQGSYEIVQYLLQHGANPNQLAAGRTPLMDAVSSGRPDLVKLLLQHGANPNPQPGMSLLEEARNRQQEDDEMIQLLVEAGAQ